MTAIFASPVDEWLPGSNDVLGEAPIDACSDLHVDDGAVAIEKSTGALDRAPYEV